MPQLIENHFSDEDYRVMDENHLGNPLYVYRPKRGYIRFMFGISLVSVMMILLTVWGVASAVRWPPVKPIDIAFLLTLPVLIVGGLYLFITIPHERSLRILVGEHGLLQVKKMLRGNRVETVEWKNIRAIRRSLINRGYSIKRRRGEPLEVSAYTYQNIDELFALIKEHEVEWSNQE